MTKHTPGPWKVTRRKQRGGSGLREERQDWIGYHRRIITEKGFPVCKLQDSVPDTYGFGTAESESEANAALIAAAPELLEALRGALHYMVSGQYNSENVELFIMDARAAIAAATE